MPPGLRSPIVMARPFQLPGKASAPSAGLREYSPLMAFLDRDEADLEIACNVFSVPDIFAVTDTRRGQDVDGNAFYGAGEGECSGRECERTGCR